MRMTRVESIVFTIPQLYRSTSPTKSVLQQQSAYVPKKGDFLTLV